MVKGLHTSAQGMIPLMAKQDQIANNLANIATTAYKKSHMLTKSFTQYLRNDQYQPFVNDRIEINEVAIDFSQGPLKQTDNPLDVAIEGEGFFVVETPQGRRMTRNGNFSIDRHKRLVTANGYPVIAKTRSGKDKIVTVEGKSVNIMANGTVTVDGEEEGILKIVTLNKPFAVDREGNSLYKPRRPDIRIFASQDYRLHQGFLEASNADPVGTMVEMISSFRNYEANQKAIWAQNETLGKAVNEVGRIQ